MSKVIKIIELSAEWVMPGYTVESLQSSGHVCGYCNGNGYLEGYDEFGESIKEPCEVCGGSGRLDAKIIIDWRKGE